MLFQYLLPAGMHHLFWTLYKIANSERHDFEGDVTIINRWAKILGLDTAFNWIDFEDMPESYFDDV